MHFFCASACECRRSAAAAELARRTCGWAPTRRAAHRASGAPSFPGWGGRRGAWFSGPRPARRSPLRGSARDVPRPSAPLQRPPPPTDGRCSHRLPAASLLVLADTFANGSSQPSVVSRAIQGPLCLCWTGAVSVAPNPAGHQRPGGWAARQAQSAAGGWARAPFSPCSRLRCVRSAAGFVGPTADVKQLGERVCESVWPGTPDGGGSCRLYECVGLGAGSVGGNMDHQAAVCFCSFPVHSSLFNNPTSKRRHLAQS